MLFIWFDDVIGCLRWDRFCLWGDFDIEDVAIGVVFLSGEYVDDFLYDIGVELKGRFIDYCLLLYKYMSICE